MPKRQYSDNDKAKVLTCLKANGGNLSATAREMCISISTVRDWRDGHGIVPDVAEIQQGMEKPLAERLEALIDQIVGAMPFKVDKASLRDSGATVGVLIDKSRLLRDKPTQINENRSDLNETAIAAYATKFGLELVQARAEIAKVAQDAGIPLSSDAVQ